MTTSATSPKLLTHEQRLVAHFVVQSYEERQRLLAEARRDPKASGPLIMVYEYLLTS